MFLASLRPGISTYSELHLPCSTARMGLGVLEDHRLIHVPGRFCSPPAPAPPPPSSEEPSTCVLNMLCSQERRKCSTRTKQDHRVKRHLHRRSRASSMTTAAPRLSCWCRSRATTPTILWYALNEYARMEKAMVPALTGLSRTGRYGSAMSSSSSCRSRPSWWPRSVRCWRPTR